MCNQAKSPSTLICVYTVHSVIRKMTNCKDHFHERKKKKTFPNRLVMISFLIQSGLQVTFYCVRLTHTHTLDSIVSICKTCLFSMFMG